MKAAIAHLKLADPILGVVIDQIKLPDRSPETNYFWSLTQAIIGQQLSEKAADTIISRFVKLFKTTPPTPKEVLKIPDEKIRAAGISFQKISYIKDLAKHTEEGLLNFTEIINLPDEEIIIRLTAIKGIGKWTAEMFLMFALNRPDIFSYGDLGLKNAIKKLYKIKNHPSEKRAKQISNKWKPYRTLACRYLWASLKLPQSP